MIICFTLCVPIAYGFGAKIDKRGVIFIGMLLNIAGVGVSGYDFKSVSILSGQALMGSGCAFVIVAVSGEIRNLAKS